MKKAWSLSTTVRNPDRILSFLNVLKEMEGENFDEEGQIKYQTLLIQNRLYKPIHLPANLEGYYETVNDKMTFDQAVEIFGFMKDKSSELKRSPGLRGRTSVAPITKMGLAVAKKSSGSVIITNFGKAFLNNEIDLGEVFFRFLLKWQIPNPESDDYSINDGYNIKPFVGVLHLINSVNRKSEEAGKEPKGISKQEFSLFAPTLVNYGEIENYSNDIINLRNRLEGKNKREQKEIFEDYKNKFSEKFLGISDRTEVNKLLSNLKDYGDNAIRYFRLTRYIYIRGGGFYIDLEPRRHIEIKNLLSFYNGSCLLFDSKEQYAKYITDFAEPKLPWETKSKLVEIINDVVSDVRSKEQMLNLEEKDIPDYQSFDDNSLKKLIEEFRLYRRSLQEKENHNISQNVDNVNKYIEALNNIYKEKDKPIALEKYTALSLHALNDALKIQPNYPVGDDNEPTFTAPAGKPDIECYYNSFNAICEVTMLTGRDQWYNEGQPIMRHLRDFEDKNSNKDAYCLFVAPSLHRDTLNTFWFSVKYEYEGKKQKIIPLSINNFLELLKTLVVIKNKGQSLPHSEIAKLYNNILLSSNESRDVNEWMQKIPSVILTWQHELTA